MQPGVRLGAYEILAPLGAGGMGEVYKAHDSRLQRDVAIKLLPSHLATDADALARFEREALSVARLSHPNVLAVYEFGRQEQIAYLATELIDGDTLRARLESGPLRPRRAVAYALQIARGLAAAHARGIVHRDLKPDNVMITRDDHVKLVDFGLARPTDAVESGATRSVGIATNAGVVLGTFGYMAPEQVRAQPLDHRADLFAFGCVLYEMLSGRRAFKGDTPADTMSAILTNEPPDLEIESLGISSGLDRIVRRCLEKSPDLRFQSANDLAFALDTLSTTSTKSATPAPPPRGRRRVLALALGAILLVTTGYLAGRITTPAAVSDLPQFARLTFRRGEVWAARFAPDGQSIVYSASWDGEPYRVYPVRLDQPRAEAQPVVDGTLLSVSRTGEMAIAHKPLKEDLFIQRGTLAQVALAGGQPRLVLDDVTYADYTPDGRLAIVRSTAGRSRLEFPSGTAVYETAGWISDVRFSPDGKQLAFLDHPLRHDDRGWAAVVDPLTKTTR